MKSRTTLAILCTTLAVTTHCNRNSKCPAGMVGIPGGSYTLGDFTLAENKRQASISASCMDRTEVTVAAYQKCVDAGTCSQPDASGSKRQNEDCNWKKAGRENHPVNCVDWDQATKYCSWTGSRLPSEEEWEWAARGGDKGWKYPWGEEEPKDQLCWGGSVPPQSTCAVGTYPADTNPWGVKDLGGNVWEWTSSLESDKSTNRVYRGGGYVVADSTDSRLSLKPVVLASFRNGFAPGTRGSRVGFRCVKNAP